MSLVTRCPGCRTLFRVTPVQLQQRSGKVRCGRCMLTFDGFDALAVEQLAAPGDAARLEPDASNASAGVAMPATPATVSEPDRTPPPATAITTPSQVSQQPRPPRPVSARSPPVQTAGRPAVPEEPVVRDAAQRGRWGVGSVILLLLLLAQAVFVYRSELAARFSAIRSAMTDICDRAGCTVTLPQRPDLVKIEASDVHITDVSRPGLIQLTATLRSYANYDLAYPALDLVLTNANDHALARRIFVPDEYLDSSRDPKRGISPNAEITVALDLDTTDLNAAGFRLDLRPAPGP